MKLDEVKGSEDLLKKDINQQVMQKKFVQLRQQWDFIYQNGAVDTMWADGVTLNHIREKLIMMLKTYEPNIDCVDIPDRVSESYMAKTAEIRSQAEKNALRYQNHVEYQFLQMRIDELSSFEKKKTGIITVLGKIQNLIQAVEQDNLVLMREYGQDMLFLELLHTTVERVNQLPPEKETIKQPKTVKKKQPKKADIIQSEQEDWQLKGQMSIYDFAS